jgi:hypothetical protein
MAAPRGVQDFVNCEDYSVEFLSFDRELFSPGCGQGVVGEGSLYPALQRLLLKGWVKAECGASENNRRARY